MTKAFWAVIRKGGIEYKGYKEFLLQPEIRCATAAASYPNAFFRASYLLISCALGHQNVRFAARVDAARTCCKSKTTCVKQWVKKGMRNKLRSYNAAPLPLRAVLTNALASAELFAKSVCMTAATLKKAKKLYRTTTDPTSTCAFLA